jgi:hypothetical protein
LSAETGSRAVFSLALAAWITSAAACVQPLGPGYHFADRQADIRFAAAAPGTLHFRVADHLQNSGDRPLRSLDVRLPEGPAFGTQNLRLAVEGSEVSPEHSSRSDPRMMRAPFDPKWELGGKRTVVTEWDLLPDSSPRGTIFASPDGFFIADETALPLWQTPRGFLAVGGTKPDKELLTIYTPPDFRVLAPGKVQKGTKDGSQVARRFLITPPRDFLPYIVAGRYQEQIVSARDGAVRFWTFKTMDTPAAQAVADRLSASMKSLADYFRARPSETVGVRIVESPVQLSGEFLGAADPGGDSFPYGALLDPRVFQNGLAGETVLQLAEYELARTWFGWRVRPRPEAQILMGRGTGLFGLVIAAEGRGPDQRQAMIASLIARYDEARTAAPDRRLMEPPVGYSHAERVSTGYRGALFIVALEDLCGHDNLRTALRDIIHDRAESDTGYEELRAAAETASGKELAEVFRRWLTEPGIPDDFRAKYQKPASAELQEQR